MKRGPYNKPGVIIIKYCPCGNEARKLNGVYMREQNCYICQRCYEIERRFVYETSGPFERRGAREKPSLIEEMEML